MEYARQEKTIFKTMHNQRKKRHEVLIDYELRDYNVVDIMDLLSVLSKHSNG
jgi:hypothetical protein